MANAHFSKRSVPLDCIRTLAITLVFGFHVAIFYDRADLDAVARFFLRFGFYGVDIFFPLSGFLITRFLLRSSRPDFVKAFFLRRVFRILPLYLAGVTLYAAASIVTGYEQELLSRIWIPYLFLTGWFVFSEGVQTVPYTITWSLSVEEFAYILFGVLAWINRARFPLFIVVLIIVPTVLRYYLNTQGLDHIYYYPPARIDAIAIGGLTALLLDRWAGRETALIGLYLGLSALFWAVGFTDILMRQTLFFTAISFTTCAVILICEVWLRGASGVISTELARVGFYSYFIYLFHYFVIFGVNAVLAKLEITLGFWPVMSLCFGVTYGAAILSYKLFEGPMIDLGRKLEHHRAPAKGTT